jgi:rare lipoprotein A
MRHNHVGLLSPSMPILRSVKKAVALIFMLCAAVAMADPEMQGLASWYGGKFHGRLTSSGEVFDTNTMTAAHKTLPFGTMVKVTNLDNGATAIVKINDRGPFVEGRVIDLSRAAADALGMVGIGVAHVSLEIVGFAAEKDLYAIQVGAYGLEKNAERARLALEAAGFLTTIEKTALGVARVLVRGIASKDLPETRKKLESLGFSQYLVKKERTEPAQVAQGGGSAPPAPAIP